MRTSNQVSTQRKTSRVRVTDAVAQLFSYSVIQPSSYSALQLSSYSAIQLSNYPAIQLFSYIEAQHASIHAASMCHYILHHCCSLTCLLFCVGQRSDNQWDDCNGELQDNCDENVHGLYTFLHARNLKSEYMLACLCAGSIAITS